MDKLYRELNELDLGGIYHWVMENNPSHGLPYHNNFHLEQVTKFALYGCEYYKIEIPYKRLVAVAALFHDFNHTGSGKDDDKNILNAVEGFLEFNKDSKFLDEEEKFIINLIKATRYPYIKESDYLTLTENILRDSDILQGPFCQNYINGVVFAIARESGIPFDKMIEGQSNFLKSMVFGTEWANDLYKTILPDILKKVEEVKILNKK